MKDLIEALQIMLTRGDVHNPTHCEHCELHVFPVDMEFTDEQFTRLEELGFFPDEDRFVSFKYGSC